jgi:aminoglycoside 6'-N-acetyltransferase I
MRILALKRDQIAEWQRLRALLWPHISPEVHRREIVDILSDLEFNAIFVAVGSDGKLHGFIEASIRMTAEGCRTHPVGYIEGWFVEPKHRDRRVGTKLVQKAEAWALARGCREMASDAKMEDEAARAAHTRLGYEETARLAHFRKSIKDREEQIAPQRPSRVSGGA